MSYLYNQKKKKSGDGDSPSSATQPDWPFALAFNSRLAGFFSLQESGRLFFSFLVAPAELKEGVER